jgi:hypothetical protein
VCCARQRMCPWQIMCASEEVFRAVLEVTQCIRCVQLESVSALGDLLESSVRDNRLPLSEVPAAFTRRRKRTVAVMQKLELLNALSAALPPGAPKAGTWWQRLQALVVWRWSMAVGAFLQRALPGVKQSPLTSALLNPRVGYDGTLALATGGAAVSGLSALAALVYVALKVAAKA